MYACHLFALLMIGLKLHGIPCVTSFKEKHFYGIYAIILVCLFVCICLCVFL